MLIGAFSLPRSQILFFKKRRFWLRLHTKDAVRRHLASLSGKGENQYMKIKLAHVTYASQEGG